VSFIAPIIVDTALGAIDRHIGEFKRYGQKLVTPDQAAA
jgi:hypothetical protein